MFPCVWREIGFFYTGGTGTHRTFGRRGYYASVSCNKPGRFIVPAFAGKRIRKRRCRDGNLSCFATVRDSLNEGVGIAAPQVGISRQLVAVQRLDKTGEPFEFYVNPEIIYFSQDTVLGQDGCLSIPGRMGAVYRSKEIVVRYRDELSFEWRQDTVREFTARIFQHEIDHLNGILYTDYLP